MEAGMTVEGKFDSHILYIKIVSNWNGNTRTELLIHMRAILT